MHTLSCLSDFADDFIPNFSLRPYSENLTKQAHEGGSVDITVVTKDFCKLSCCHFSYDILAKIYQWRSLLRPTLKFTQRHFKEACWKLNIPQQGFLELMLVLRDCGNPPPRVVLPASGNRVFPKTDRSGWPLPDSYWKRDQTSAQNLGLLPLLPGHEPQRLIESPQPLDVACNKKNWLWLANASPANCRGGSWTSEPR